MRSSTFFLAGFLLTLAVSSFWQKEFILGLPSNLETKEKIVSPLVLAPSIAPQVLGEVTTLENNFDFGKIMPEEKVLSQGAFVYDLTKDQPIFEKDSRQKLQAASTVKIVTAAVSLDKGSLSEEMVVNFFPTVVGESSMSLAFGEKFTLEELLYGLLMVSGNDAAETIAQGLAGQRDVYIQWMNEFAKKAGAINTHFTTPSGLDEDGQYTTAHDLFLMGRYVFEKYPEILEISTTREKYLPKTSSHKAYLLRNKLLLLDAFPILGGKPGLGENGMLSLVALLDLGGRRILVTLVRTPSIRHDLTQILKLL